MNDAEYILSLEDERDRLRELLEDALNSFKITQKLADYSKDHWSNRAQAELQEDRDG